MDSLDRTDPLFKDLYCFIEWGDRKNYHCRRGVRQEDPLSLSLFVLATDLLQSLVNRIKDMGSYKILRWKTFSQW